MAPFAATASAVYPLKVHIIGKGRICMKKLVVGIVALLATVGQVGVLTANHIDFVSDGGFFAATNSNAGPVTVFQTGDAGNILGTERQVTLTVASGQGIVSAGIVGVAPGPGPVGPSPTTSLLLNNSFGALGLFDLTYDGVGSAGLGGQDFETLWDRIAVTFSGVQGAGSLTVEVEDASNNVGAMTQAVNAAGVFSFPFNNSGYGSVDFRAVDRVTVKLLTTVAASDFELSEITREMIPEPSVATLSVLGLVGLVAAGRRARMTRLAS